MSRKFTAEDAGLILGLADQFIKDWETHEGKGDPDCANARATFDQCRPLFLTAPDLLAALIDLRFDCVHGNGAATWEKHKEAARVAIAKAEDVS